MNFKELFNLIHHAGFSGGTKRAENGEGYGKDLTIYSNRYCDLGGRNELVILLSEHHPNRDEIIELITSKSNLVIYENKK